MSVVVGVGVGGGVAVIVAVAVAVAVAVVVIVAVVASPAHPGRSKHKAAIITKIHMIFFSLPLSFNIFLLDIE